MRIEDYFFGVPFEFELTDQYKLEQISKFTEYYASKIMNPHLSESMSWANDDVKTEYENKVKCVIEDVFETGECTGQNSFLYIQNNKIHKSLFHTHITAGALSTVYYMDLPKSGGELEICWYDSNGPKTEKLNVEEKTLYFFPNWMIHRPAPQKDKSFRICINSNYETHSRVRRKDTGKFW